MLFLQQKWLLCFSYLALALFLVELRWTVALLSLFLCLSLYLFSKFLDMTINLNLIIWTTRIQKHFPLSVFVFIDSFLVSASQDAGGHTLSCQNNLTCATAYMQWVYGRSAFERYVRTKFTFFHRLPIYLSDGAPPRALHARGSSANNGNFICVLECTIVNLATHRQFTNAAWDWIIKKKKKTQKTYTKKKAKQENKRNQNCI